MRDGPRRINFGSGEGQGSSPSDGPKRRKIPDAPVARKIPDATQTHVETAGAPPRRRIPDAAPPSRVECAPSNRMSSTPAQSNLVDCVLEKAQSIDTSLDVMRIKGRVQTILAMTLTDILDWGERNLAPLRDVSNKKTAITAEMLRINAFQWLQDAKAASCKSPSFMDRFNTKTPEYYENMLLKTRAEMLDFTKRLSIMRREFEREVTDLHLDAVAMTACWDQYGDMSEQQCAQERAKTLTMAHQTAVMLYMTIDQTVAQCAQAVQQIDSFISVTMPNWKLAHGK